MRGAIVVISLLFGEIKQGGDVGEREREEGLCHQKDFFPQTSHSGKSNILCVGTSLAPQREIPLHFSFMAIGV